MKKILGLGNALTDILLQVSEDDLRELGFPKGSMNLISKDQAEQIQYRFLSVRKRMVAGGSASNTINTVAALGGKAAFIGKIGNDEVGDFYREDMLKNGVKPILLLSQNAMSGFSIVLVTPDGERTFATYLGAAAELCADDIQKDAFNGYDIFHIEGYLVQNHELIEKAIRLAKEAGCMVSLDLASYNVVNENHAFLKGLVKQYVDIVFANEEESAAFTGESDPRDALDEIARLCEIAVVKLGSKGSCAKRGDEVAVVQANHVDVVDTTAAGDFFAGGFLYALTHGASLEKCLLVGGHLSENVIQIVGTRLPDERWEYINNNVKEILK